MMTNYYRVCKGVNDKGVLLPEGTSLDPYKNGEAFVSVYKYNKKHLDFFKQSGSIAGITDVKTDILYFDFDSTNLEDSRKDAIETVERLNELGIAVEDVRIAFSGSKGIHLTVHTDKEMTPDEAKTAAMNIAGDLKTFDSVIYNPSRIIRIEGSVHGTTGLRKTPLLFDELKSMSFDEIKALAKDQYIYEKPKKVKLPDSVFVKKTKEQPKKEATSNFKVDYNNNPLDLFPMKLAISQGIYPSGQRHNSLAILAATLKHKNVDKTDAYYLLKAAADKQSVRFGSDRTDKKEIWNTVNSIYENWNGGTYSEDNFPTGLMNFFQEHDIPLRKDADLFTEKYAPRKIEHAQSNFLKFVEEFDKNVISTGLKPIDDAMPLTPGMNLGIIGSAGSGKSSMAIKLLEHCANNGIYCIFASIDMNSMRLYEKLLYRVSGLDRKTLYEKIRNGEAEDYIKKVNNLLRTTYIYDRSGATIEDIRKYHTAIEKRDGVKIKMTMVDYFERINSDISDDTASSKKVAGEWQDYVNDTGVVGIMFVQPSKNAIGGGPNSPILDYRSIKGSSFLYQSFRGIISLWRPFYTPDLAKYDNYMEMAILKNDLGELARFEFGWSGKRGDIYQLDAQGKVNFKALKEQLLSEDDDDDI